MTVPTAEAPACAPGVPVRHVLFLDGNFSDINFPDVNLMAPISVSARNSAHH
jgi:hypothetical protein